MTKRFWALLCRPMSSWTKQKGEESKHISLAPCYRCALFPRFEWIGDVDRTLSQKEKGRRGSWGALWYLLQSPH